MALVPSVTLQGFSLCSKKYCFLQLYNVTLSISSFLFCGSCIMSFTFLKQCLDMTDKICLKSQGSTWWSKGIITVIKSVLTLICFTFMSYAACTSLELHIVYEFCCQKFASPFKNVLFCNLHILLFHWHLPWKVKIESPSFLSHPYNCERHLTFQKCLFGKASQQNLLIFPQITAISILNRLAGKKISRN